MVRKNKKGWIKVIEAFIAIIALIGILTIIIQSERVSSERINIFEEKSLEILKGIQMDETLREEILTESTIPVSSEDSGFPAPIKTYLDNSNLKTSECILKICAVNDDCLITSPDNAEVFSKDILVTSTKDYYNPRKLKIFCIKE